MKFNKRKTLMFKILDILPSRLGYFIYHSLQRKSFQNIDSNLKSNIASIEKIKQVLKKHNLDVTNEKVIEIGSGWLPIIPFLFKSELSVSKVITYDINRHYNTKRIRSVREYFKNLKFDNRPFSGLELPDFIDYYPRTNIIAAPIEKNVKLIFSRFVLEHVKPSDIEEMHLKFFKEHDTDVKILHLISPSDHRAYSDKTVSYYDFLKYSQKEWDKIQTKFDYHNRLRLPEYVEIFEKSGFKIIHLEYDSVDQNSNKYLKFKELKLHSDYYKFNEKDLLAGSICVLLEKKNNLSVQIK